MPPLNDKPPKPAALLACVLITWLAACVSVVAAILSRNWGLLVMAFAAALNAAGWLMAAQQWQEWRALAMAAVEELGQMRRG